MFEHPYFNSDEPFLNSYPRNGPCIAMLMPTVEETLVNALCATLKSLAFLQGDDKKFPAPVLVFNDGKLSGDQKKFLVSCTARPITFPLVNSLDDLPEGYSPSLSSIISHGKADERRRCNISRFWMAGIWKHPSIKLYETILRIEPNSCFKQPNEFLPNFKYTGYHYHSQFFGLDPKDGDSNGLLEYTERFLEDIGRSPGDPMMMDFIKASWELHGRLPVFRSNFEVMSKTFMTRWDVKRWYEELTEKKPFGMYENLWNEGTIRFVSAALFAKSSEISTSYPMGFAQDACSMKEVEAALQNSNVV